MKRPSKNASGSGKPITTSSTPGGLWLSSNFSCAVFFADQAAQQALKADLPGEGLRLVVLHRAGDLAELAAQSDPSFAIPVGAGTRLKRRCLTTRYPNALPQPTIPAEAYPSEDAEEAAPAAGAILDDVPRGLPPAG